MLIQLGDVTDCYPDVYECVETLLTVINLIAIKGNHDDWFCEFISTDFHPQYWNHGGLGTLTSYLDHAGKARQYKETGRGYKTALISSDVPVTHQNFFMRQQLHHVDEHSRCFVHGGFKPEVPFYLQRPEEFYWNRTLWDNTYQHQLFTQSCNDSDPFGYVSEFREIYLGHTPTTNYGSKQPLNAFNIWNLDTGAGHSGLLTIMDVNTKEYWQSDPVMELYEKNMR
ncbi:serine/threonine protein phosphatase 1 [bacterium A37T11]|nr:serine/threonine protein phosphatase 1 [bacterium A37T11]